jgi:SOS-response transcriptional repressor LexA
MPRSSTSSVQDDILSYVRAYYSMHGLGPSYREIQDAVGIPSRTLAGYHVKRLVKRGLVVVASGRAHSVIPIARPLPLASANSNSQNR